MPDPRHQEIIAELTRRNAWQNDPRKREIVAELDRRGSIDLSALSRRRTADTVAARAKELGITPQAAKQQGVAPAHEGAKAQSRKQRRAQVAQAQQQLLKSRFDTPPAEEAPNLTAARRKELAPKWKQQAKQQKAYRALNPQQSRSILDRIQPGFDETLAQTPGFYGGLAEVANALIQPESLATMGGVGTLMKLMSAPAKAALTRGLFAQGAVGVGQAATDKKAWKADPVRQGTVAGLNALLMVPDAFGLWQSRRPLRSLEDVLAAAPPAPVAPELAPVAPELAPVAPKPTPRQKKAAKKQQAAPVAEVPAAVPPVVAETAPVVGDILEPQALAAAPAAKPRRAKRPRMGAVSVPDALPAGQGTDRAGVGRGESNAGVVPEQPAPAGEALNAPVVGDILEQQGSIRSGGSNPGGVATRKGGRRTESVARAKPSVPEITEPPRAGADQAAALPPAGEALNAPPVPAAAAPQTPRARKNARKVQPAAAPAGQPEQRGTGAVQAPEQAAPEAPVTPAPAADDRTIRLSHSSDGNFGYYEPTLKDARLVEDFVKQSGVQPLTKSYRKFRDTDFERVAKEAERQGYRLERPDRAAQGEQAQGSVAVAEQAPAAPDTRGILEPSAEEAARVAASVGKEKVQKDTGLTKTQEAYLSGKLREIAGSLNGKPVRIPIPGDGEFTVSTPQQASQLHANVTGKPVDAILPAKKQSLRFSGEGSPVENPSLKASRNPYGAAEESYRLEQAYGSAAQALEATERQLARTPGNVDVENLVHQLRKRVREEAAIAAKKAAEALAPPTPKPAPPTPKTPRQKKAEKAASKPNLRLSADEASTLEFHTHNEDLANKILAPFTDESVRRAAYTFTPEELAEIRKIVGQIKEWPGGFDSNYFKNKIAATGQQAPASKGIGTGTPKGRAQKGAVDLNPLSGKPGSPADRTGKALRSLAERLVKPDPKERNAVAKTSVRQVPALFRSLSLPPGTRNIDIGGGRFEDGTNFLREKQIESHVLDPYNRSEDHNRSVAARFSQDPADTATVANVLNVIEDPAIRRSVIASSAQYVKPGGKVYFSVYEGNGSGTGSKTATGSWQENRRLPTYLSEIRAVFPDARKEKGYIVATVGKSHPLTDKPQKMNMGVTPADIKESISEIAARGKDIVQGVTASRKAKRAMRVSGPSGLQKLSRTYGTPTTPTDAQGQRIGPTGRLTALGVADAERPIRDASIRMERRRAKADADVDAIGALLHAARPEVEAYLNQTTGKKGRVTRRLIDDVFIQLVEMDRTDPTRLNVGKAYPTLGKALDLHDKMTEELRVAIRDSLREAGSDVPDDWGITEQGYFRHLFLNDIELFEFDATGQPKQVHPHGKFNFGSYAEAQAYVARRLKQDPNLTFEARARDISAGDPTLRTSDRQYFRGVNEIRKDVNQTLASKGSAVKIDNADIMADLKGTLGRQEKRVKFLGAAQKRTGAAGYLRHYERAMRIAHGQAIRSIELSRLNREIVPIKERAAANGNPDGATLITEILEIAWGTPRGHLETMGGISPMTVRKVSQGVRAAVATTRLKTNVFSALANALDTTRTLYPRIGEKAYVRAYKDYLFGTRGGVGTQQWLREKGILSADTRLDKQGNLHRGKRKGLARLDLFTKASEMNRGVGYLHGYDEAQALLKADPDAWKKAGGYNDAEDFADTNGRVWSRVAEYMGDEFHAPTFLGSSGRKTAFQFTNYKIKSIENANDLLRGNPASKAWWKRAARYLGPTFVQGGVKGFGVASSVATKAGVPLLLAKVLADSLGIREEDAKDIVERGVLSKALGVDMSSKVAIGEAPFGNTIKEQAASAAFGPAANITMDFLQKKTPGDKLSTLIPAKKQAESLADLLRGKPSTKITRTKRMRLTRTEGVMQTLGGTPLRKSKLYDPKPKR